jgi:hypothetical protein
MKKIKRGKSLTFKTKSAQNGKKERKKEEKKKRILLKLFVSRTAFTAQASCKYCSGL